MDTGYLLEREIRNVEFRERTALQKVDLIIEERRLRWFGHILWMDDGRLSKHVMPWEVNTTKWRMGSARKNCIDTKFLTQSMWLMRRSDKWRNACQSLIRCEPVDYVSLAKLHEFSPLKTIYVLFGLRCRSHLCPGSDPQEGQAWLGYEWARTTSNQWTLVFTPLGGKQMTVRNGVASWAQQCSSRSRLWRERERP